MCIRDRWPAKALYSSCNALSTILNPTECSDYVQGDYGKGRESASSLSGLFQLYPCQELPIVITKSGLFRFKASSPNTNNLLLYRIHVGYNFE